MSRSSFRDQNTKRLSFLSNLSKTTAAICVLRGPELIFEFVSEGFKKITGDRSYLDRPLVQALPELRGQKLLQVFERAYQTGQSAAGNEESLVVKQADGQHLEGIYDYQIEPCFDDAGQVDGLVLTAFDVTEEVLARREAERIETWYQVQRRNFFDLFAQTPELLCLLRSPEHVFEYVNEAHIRALGFDATGKTVREAQPESTEVHGLLDHVYHTGETAHLHELAVTIRESYRYFNLTFAARRDSEGRIIGVILLGMEVTNEVLYREELKESEEQLKFALSSAQMGAWRVGLSTQYVYLSEEALQIFGIAKPYASCRQAVDELVHPDDRERVWKVLSEATRSGHPYVSEYRIIPPDGRLRWVQSRGRARFDRNGHPVALLGIVLDITERKAQQDALRESEERMKFALTAAHIGTFEIDFVSGQCLTSPIAEEIVGRKGLSGDWNESIRICLGMKEAERMQQLMEVAIRERRPLKEEFRVIRPDGALVWVLCQGEARYGEWGEAVRFSGVMQDISEQKRFERELKRAKEEAIRANELKSVFLANTSHEIRTPLGSILGFTELMKDPSVDADEKSAYLDIISRNGEQLTTIINDVLDLSKIEAGEMTVELLKCSPRAILEEAVALMSVRARDKRLELQLNVNSSVPDTVGTDPVRLRQIVVNLLSNAIKFTNEGRVVVRAWYESSEPEDGELVIEVCDTGIGLSKDQQRRLFKSFAQGDESTTRKFGGTGLGLSLSRRLAEALQGELRLMHSEPGKGAVFQVRIADQGTKAKDRAPVEGTDTREGKAGDEDLSNVEVLLVEDSPDNQNLVSKILTRKHAHVTIASNGLEGVEKAIEGKFDLVLMDVQMPVMDGYAATRRLRERGYRKPIIALTAHAMSQAQHLAMVAGCSDYLAKPINSKDLLAKVAFYSHHRRTESDPE